MGIEDRFSIVLPPAPCRIGIAATAMLVLAGCAGGAGDGQAEPSRPLPDCDRTCQEEYIDRYPDRLLALEPARGAGRCALVA